MEQGRAWRNVKEIKVRLVDLICKELGERTVDLRKENVKVFAIEHHCNEALWGNIGVISNNGFTMDDDTEEIIWHDMIVEDLAMVLDYLKTGVW